MKTVAVARGEKLYRYSFPEPHPLNKIRLERFYELLSNDKPLAEKIEFVEPVKASIDEIALFHTENYVKFVEEKCEKGYGYLDYGDTPAFPNCFEAASYVVGTTLTLLKKVLKGETLASFNPMGGLHHARRDRAGGFCIFNDAGVAIEYLLKVKGVSNVAYVDIDAHHGDGVCYDFYSDERIIFADIHQDGRTLYPGTGFQNETGEGKAKGRKLNIPLMPFSGDGEFFQAFDKVVSFLENFDFDILLFQCGADGLMGDPLTNLQYTHEAHRNAVKMLKKIARKKCDGKILAMGGGGYNPDNVAIAWKSVVEGLAEESER